jgi:hypothetical protein
MERREFIALLGSAAALIPSHTAAVSACPSSTSQSVAGTWSLISSVNTRTDGTLVDRWGPNPKGILIFDGSGNFSHVVTGSESRIFGSKNYCAFGRYDFEPGKETITLRFEGCSIAKLIGSVQRRVIVVLTEHEFKYMNPSSSSGTSSEVSWKRLA